MRSFKTRQVEIAKEHDIGIQDAISLVRQRDGRGNLQKLLYVPAADRLGSERPPILAPLALDEAGERPQPFGEELRCRKYPPALALEMRNSGKSQSGTNR